jgi:hypothetical protein
MLVSILMAAAIDQSFTTCAALVRSGSRDTADKLSKQGNEELGLGGES